MNSPVTVGVDGSACSLAAVDPAAREAALGSVSQAVLHHAACPVATVPHARRREEA